MEDGSQDLIPRLPRSHPNLKQGSEPLGGPQLPPPAERSRNISSLSWEHYKAHFIDACKVVCELLTEQIKEQINR